MSNFGPQAGPPARLRPPTLSVPQGRVIARYPTYDLAQRAVDFLSDNRLPVQAVTIVGTDLRVVERVTGRLTYGRVAVQGVMSGAWFGLLIGILLSLSSAAPEGGVATAILFGAGFGLLFAVISYASTRGRRDFTSRSEIVAGEYQILCADALVATASELLARLPSAGPPVDLPPPVPPAGQAGWPTQQSHQQPHQPPGSTWPAPPQPGPTPPGLGQPGATPPGPAPSWPPTTAVPPQDAPTGAPSWPPATVATPTTAPVAPEPPRGPTYSEMIEKQKRERLERERAEREASQRAAAERAAAERAAAGPEASQPRTDVQSADNQPADTPDGAASGPGEGSDS